MSDRGAEARIKQQLKPIKIRHEHGGGKVTVRVGNVEREMETREGVEARLLQSMQKEETEATGGKVRDTSKK